MWLFDITTHVKHFFIKCYLPHPLFHFHETLPVGWRLVFACCCSTLADHCCIALTALSFALLSIWPHLPVDRLIHSPYFQCYPWSSEADMYLLCEIIFLFKELNRVLGLVSTFKVKKISTNTSKYPIYVTLRPLLRFYKS